MKSTQNQGDGPSPQVYTLEFRFELAPERSLSGLEIPAVLHLDNFTGQLERIPVGYRMTVTGLPSAEAASNLASPLWAGLALLSLDVNFPFQAPPANRS